MRDESCEIWGPGSFFMGEAQVLGFRVSGSEFGAWGWGLRIYGLKFRVCGLGLWVWGGGFGVKVGGYL